jgi:hypothetical protein
MFKNVNVYQCKYVNLQMYLSRLPICKCKYRCLGLMIGKYNTKVSHLIFLYIVY